MHRFRALTRTAVLGLFVAASILATPAAEAVTPAGCVDIDGETFCPNFGFTKLSPSTVAATLSQAAASSRSTNAASAPDDASTGDMSREDYAAYLATLTPAQRKASEAEQIAAARTAVGKIKLVDYLAAGQGIPAGFFEKYPNLQIKEGSTLAASLRAEAKVKPSATARAGAVTPQAISSDPTKDYEYIMPNVARQQETDYYCGPATMQMIDLGDVGSPNKGQTTWATRMGTSEDGTAIDVLVSKLNAFTTWDDTAGGAYVVQSAAGRDQDWFMTAHRAQIGLTKSPVVEHPKLLKTYFTYLKRDHGGHFQVGRGYSRTSTPATIGIIEPYNERTWWGTAGNVTGGYVSVPLSLMFSATLANTGHKNFGY